MHCIFLFSIYRLGCCHSFHEKGFEFDTGIHYIGEMRNNTTFRFLLDQLSNGHLKWTNVADDFDTVVMVGGDGNPARALEDIDVAVAANSTLKAKWVCWKPSEYENFSYLI